MIMTQKISIKGQDGKINNKPDDKSSDKPFIVSSLFYMLVILFIGLPMWFSTCSKTRYSLPSLIEFEASLDKSHLKLHLDISVVDLSQQYTTKLHDELSHYEDHQTIHLRNNLPNHFATSIEGIEYNINWRVRRPTHDEINSFIEHSKRGQNTFNKENPHALQELEINLIKIHPSANRFRIFMYLIDESNYSSFCDPMKTHTYTTSFERFIFLCPSVASNSTETYESLVSLIFDAVKETYQETIDPKKLSHTLFSQIDLLHTLLPERLNPEHSDSLHTLADKLHRIFDKNVGDRFPELKELVNIRLVTQNLVDIFDSSIIEKTMLKSNMVCISDRTNSTSIASAARENNTRTVMIDKIGDLFYEFESRLSKHSSQRVHNVLTLIPDPDELSLSFGDQNNDILSFLEGQDSNTLLLANDDKSLVLGLRAIIRRLVGFSRANLCDSCLVRRNVFFNRWELDALMGALIITKLKNTLISLRSISQQVIGIKIPKDVSSIANEAYSTALVSIEHLKTKQILESYRLASKAYELSEKAFYDPSLLESLYFPDELKYAIYLPLFLPLALPLLTSVVRIMKFCLHSDETKVKIN